MARINNNVLVLIAAAGAASAAVANPILGPNQGDSSASRSTLLFQQRLIDHPNGLETPPPYGLRMDNLFVADNTGAPLPGGEAGVTTFSFGHAMASMMVQVWDDTGNGLADRIHIHGNAYGGRDTGTTYGVGEGLYAIDFTYNANVSTVPGPNGGWQTQAHATNTGSIEAVSGSFAGQVWTFHDKADATGFSFNFLRDGHRIPGNNSAHVGEGWVQLDNGVMGVQDWLFVAIPLPSTTGLALAGLLGLGCFRRRRIG
jgi:hypothetical protein